MVRRFAPLALLLASPAAAQSPPVKPPSVEQIMARFSFVADFTPKEAVRDVSPLPFWRYPYRVGAIKISIPDDFGMRPGDLVATPGSRREIEHMNRGRLIFQSGGYEESRKVFLSARFRGGNTFPYHRRNDYYIALSFLKYAEGVRKRMFKGDWRRPEVRLTYSNAATFLSWAFIKKRDLPDPFLETIAPRALFALAAIYFNFDKYGPAFGAAREGVDYLRRTGRKEERFNLRRVLVEVWIRNSQYLKAIQEVDTALRQDPSAEHLTQGLARAADIYFDLNNYTLADDLYRLSLAAAWHAKVHDLTSLILRGESLFWLGRFSEAQKVLWAAVNGVARPNVVRHPGATNLSWGHLRLADSFLARSQVAAGEEKAHLHAKALLEYYRVAREYPRERAALVARMRMACLDLPNSKGKSVLHARRYLAALRKADVPLTAQEISWYCYTRSYSDREQNDALVDRVRRFARRFPGSRFLPEFETPLVAVRGDQLRRRLRQGQWHEAISYFEANRVRIFADIDPAMRSLLFYAYVETSRSDRAREFWPDVRPPRDARELLLQATFWAETGGGMNAEIAARLGARQLEGGEVAGLDLLVTRIIASKGGSEHLGWIYALFRAKAGADLNQVCQRLYPLLVKAYQTGVRKLRRLVAGEVASFTAEHFPRLIEVDAQCAADIIELEHQAGDRSSRDFAGRWLERGDWPVNATTAGFMWLTAEELGDAGRQAEARALWTFIRDHVPAEFSEHRYAKIRLHDEKLESQELWRR